MKESNVRFGQNLIFQNSTNMSSSFFKEILNRILKLEKSEHSTVKTLNLIFFQRIPANLFVMKNFKRNYSAPQNSKIAKLHSHQADNQHKIWNLIKTSQKCLSNVTIRKQHFSSFSLFFNFKIIFSFFLKQTILFWIRKLYQSSLIIEKSKPKIKITFFWNKMLLKIYVT